MVGLTRQDHVKLSLWLPASFRRDRPDDVTR
jgi:hypothetical protein